MMVKNLAVFGLVLQVTLTRNNAMESLQANEQLNYGIVSQEELEIKQATFSKLLKME